VPFCSEGWILICSKLVSFQAKSGRLKWTECVRAVQEVSLNGNFVKSKFKEGETDEDAFAVSLAFQILVIRILEEQYGY
jgi:hypothetical protein